MYTSKTSHTARVRTVKLFWVKQVPLRKFLPQEYLFHEGKIFIENTAAHDITMK